MFSPIMARPRNQQTLAAPLVFVGIGLHSGVRATMRMRPAGVDHGISLVRRDLPRTEGKFTLDWQYVVDTTLSTTLGNEFGHTVATVEHLLSALSGLAVDNAIIELDGPEVPIMDGSALPFVEGIMHVGIRTLDVPCEVLQVRRPIRLQQGASWAELLPDNSQRITLSIDFNMHDIGLQTFCLDVSPASYQREIAPARTFGFAEQLMHLRQQGLALGGSIKNAILLEEGRVRNQEGLRFHDEFVRHKVLDVIGDLSLTGIPLLGHYRGNRPGHRLNAELVKLLMQDRSAWVRGVPQPATSAVSQVCPEPATAEDPAARILKVAHASKSRLRSSGQHRPRRNGPE